MVHFTDAYTGAMTHTRDYNIYYYTAITTTG